MSLILVHAQGALQVALAAVLAPIVAFSTDWGVQGLGDELRRVLSEQDVDAFLFVQRAHAGAYIGAALGTTIACLLVLRSRHSRGASARTAESTQAPARPASCSDTTRVFEIGAREFPAKVARPV